MPNTAGSVCAGMLFLLLVAAGASAASEMPTTPQISNSLGMKLVRLAPGTFHMGGDGDYDERPAHTVTITRPFYLAACEVTNAQYEQFEPAHRARRGEHEVSKNDDEPVTFVSWNDAQRFCQWLSAKEGLPYRLPTEAEWEYACRAGTTTKFSTGDELPPEYLGKTTRPVGALPANAWGLNDMHGNVEEWCRDWYGPYEADAQTDPVGRADGLFKVTRGGSHSTTAYYLRSANRSGTVPDDNHWLIGFRVAVGPLPAAAPLPALGPELFQRDVKQAAPPNVAKGPDPTQPYFRGPRTYVRIPPGSNGPLFSAHNHDPAITECPNGDLLAIWYTTILEEGRELAQAVSRLRYGADDWEPASPFLDTPDRNDHAPALWFDGKDTLYHFWGLSPAGDFNPLALCLRTSTDNGVTWTRPRFIAPGYSTRKQPAESVFRTQDGQIALACDDLGANGTALWMSRDNGATWYDAGGTIRGIHACVCQLKDGRLFAIGRGGAIEGMAPQSISDDLGKTWTSTKSPFPAFGAGRRGVLLRLKSGALFFSCLAIIDYAPVEVPCADGSKRKLLGIYGSLSYDDGKTWPVIRRIYPWSTGLAYLSVCQGFDGVIHLITSSDHFAFNEKWLQTPEPPPATLPVRETLGVAYKPTALPSAAMSGWQYEGSGAEAEAAALDSDGTLRLHTGGRQYCQWFSQAADGFGAADPARGCTVEIALRTLPDDGDRSLDLEVCTGPGRIYHFTFGSDCIWWCDDTRDTLPLNSLRKLNADAMHVFRVAVRPDGMAQLYRDGTLVDILPPSPRARVAAAAPPSPGPYLRWGRIITSSRTIEASVGYVAFDLSGAYRSK